MGDDQGPDMRSSLPRHAIGDVAATNTRNTIWLIIKKLDVTAWMNDPLNG